MAYAASVTYQQLAVGGTLYLVATVVETGVTLTTHEAEIEVPLVGNIVLVISTLTAGDGNATTVDPDIFEVTGTSATQRRVFANGAASSANRNAPTDAKFYTVDGKLRLHTTPNGTTGTTGNITTIVVISKSTA